MKTMTSKKSSALFASAVFLAAAGAAFACAWVDMDDLTFSFFAPETSRSEDYSPFFRSFRTLYTEMLKDDNIHDFDSINALEWSEFLGDGVTRKDIASLLSSARIGQIDTLIRRLKNPSYRAAPALAKNSILRAADKRAANDFLFFLGYAKRCEPYVAFVPGWSWEHRAERRDPRADTAAMRRLIESGTAAAMRAQDAFLHARYLFQVQRMLFHARRFRECADFYVRHGEELLAGKTVHLRAMEYAAGALHRLKRYEEANVMFARVYDAGGLRKVSAYFGYRPLEGTSLRHSLNLAGNDRERDVILHLQGIYGDPLPSMRAIGERDPESDLLDLLLVRAINLEEERVLPERWDFNGDMVYDPVLQRWRSASEPRGFGFRRDSLSIALRDFVLSMSEKGRTRKPWLWDLAAGYLLVLDGRAGEAAPRLARARANAANDRLIEQQARVIDIIAGTDAVEYPDAAFEAAIRSDLQWLKEGPFEPAVRASRVYDWVRKRLSEKYAASGDIVKAQLLHPWLDRAYHRDDSKRAAMLSFMDRSGKSAFDRYLLGEYPFTKKDIIELQAVELMLHDRFDAALDMFASHPAAGADDLYGDPFTARIKDCHDCDHAAPGGGRYTKTSFARRMQELKEAAARKPESADKMHFLLANGYYNMTYFGNARRLYETAIFPVGFVPVGISDFAADGWLPEGIAPGSPIFDCSRAERHYLLARDASKDPEFRAKCTFMAAKCEQNKFFINRPRNYSGDFRAGTHFRELKTLYSGTKYYREIIRECGYFRTYSRK